MPDIELGSDWIVGFPGESEEDFQASERLLAEQGFLVSYVFKYDPRPGTRAGEGWPDDVPGEVKKERNARLLALAERVQRARFARRIGAPAEALVESVSRRDGRILHGRTPHGMPVSFRGDAGLVGRSVELVIDEATAFGMAGRLEPAPRPA